jgi:hypothetical protein
MKKNRVLAAALLGACSAGAALVVPAFAADEDGKFYNAGFCHEAGRPSDDYFRDEGRISKVAGTGVGRVICPVVRDDLAGMTQAVAHVYVTDFFNGPEGRSTNVTCALSMRAHNGDPLYWKTDASSGASTSVQELVMDSGIRSTLDAGAWSIECTIPTDVSPYYSRIHGYSVSEFDRNL